MPPYEQNVDVTFTPGTSPTNGTWTFDPVTVHMTAAGKIILHRKPQQATWQFVTATGLPSGWPVPTVEGNGSLMKIQDPHDPPYGPPAIAYSVQVTDGTSNFASPMQGGITAVIGGPPPMVQNDP